MNRIILAALCGVFLFSGIAYAQSGATNTTQRNGYTFNNQTGQMTDANGNVLSKEAYPLSDQNLTFLSVIDRRAAVSSSMSVGQADSNLVPLDTHRCRLGTLLIKAVVGNTGGGAADTTATIRLAIQIRTHLNALTDSSSTFAFYQYGKNDMGASIATAQTDTTASGHLVTPSGYPTLKIVSVLGSPVPSWGPWSGEYVIVVSAARNAKGNTLAAWGNYFPNGIALPLSSIFGRDIYSPFTSIRVRVLSSSVGTGATCDVTVHLLGTPL